MNLTLKSDAEKAEQESSLSATHLQDEQVRK